MQIREKGKGQFHNRPNIALRLAAVLLVMVCVSIWMLDGLFARYRTRDSSQDSARVIKFGDISLTESGDFGEGGGTAFLVPGVDLKKEVKVEFTGSESETYVFVKVELPEHWSSVDNKTFSAFKNCVQWEVADKWSFIKTSDETTTEFVYYQEVAPNATFKEDFIEGGVITVSSLLTKKEMNEIANLTNDLEIKFTAYVVQSNGFASPEEAWESIAN